MNRQRKVVITTTYNDMGVIVDTKAEELDLSAQPEKRTDKHTETHACDCISRWDAIETSLEFFVEFLGGAFYENAQKELIARFQRLPSAQPKPEQITPSEQGESDKLGVKMGETCTETCTDTCTDNISRQAAIDLFPNDVLEWDTIGGYIAPHLARRMIEELPSAQPERKTGHWIEIALSNHTYKCSVCGRLLANITDGKNNVAKNYPYCHCGADMRGESDE